MKVILTIWGIALSTCYYLVVVPVKNMWMLLDYFKNVLFTVTTTGHVAFDALFFVLAFLDFYSLNKVYRREGGIGVRTYLRLIGQRYLRLAPAYYLVFFAGWLIGPFLQSGPAWYSY